MKFQIPDFKFQILWCGLAILLSCISINSSGQKGRIIGHVIDSKDLPISGATVFLFNVDSVLLDSSFCDSTGKFDFKEMDTLKYGLLYIKEGFTSYWDNSCTVLPDQIVFKNRRLFTAKDLEDRQSCYFNQSNHKPKCHICKKRDKVIPYKYGLVPRVPESMVSSNPDDSLYRIGGCVISNCQAEWYCKRDRVDILLPNGKFKRK